MGRRDRLRTGAIVAVYCAVYPFVIDVTSTKIKFNLPAQANVKLKIYNLVGELVKTILDKQMEAGYHEVYFDASGFASGIYFYRLEAENYLSIRKMLLLR